MARHLQHIKLTMDQEDGYAEHRSWASKPV